MSKYIFSWGIKARCRYLKHAALRGGVSQEKGSAQHGKAASLFPCFFFFLIPIYKSQVSDLLQAAPCPQIAQIHWVKCCHNPSSVLLCLLKAHCHHWVSTQDKMVTPRSGLEIKGLRGKMRREAAGFKRGKARRKGRKK